MSKTNYTYQFPQFEVAPLSEGRKEVVLCIHWQLVAVSEDGFKAGFDGKVHLGAPRRGASFKPFHKLTPDDVTAWVEERIYLPGVKQQLEQAIEAQRNPQVVSCRAPWEA